MQMQPRSSASITYETVCEPHGEFARASSYMVYQYRLDLGWEG